MIEEKGARHLSTGQQDLTATVSLTQVQEAHARLHNVINPTPLQRSRTLSALCGGEVWLKPESLQRTGSFKLRGAYNRIATLSADERARGVITYSSGNHAQGVACAAQILGVKAVVVMPENATPSKVAATRGYGALVEFAGFDSIERQQRALELQREHGYTMAPPFEDPAIVAGQATVGLEIVNELPAVEMVVVPCGGGGLLSGTAFAVKSLKPQAQVFGIEPEGAADARASFHAGHVIDLETINTVCDGLRVKRVGALNFALIQRHVTDIFAVPDAATIEAMRFLALRAKLVVEPSGAVGVAALLKSLVPAARGKQIAIVLSGGNVDAALLQSALAEN